jgi:hypothetical protein
MLRTAICLLSIAATSASIGCARVVPAADEWLSCAFSPIEAEATDSGERCVHRDRDGRLVVAPAGLRAMEARGAGPVAASIEGRLHYLNAAGVVVPVLVFDNGPDYFVEGLARTVQDGKVGFIDENLRVVIAPAWDFAFPFENGAAVVCDGCTLRRVGDEHEEVVGGRWGRIDARGRVVVPVIHARDAIPAAASQ